MVLCSHQQGLPSDHLAFSGVSVTSREPSRPKEDREVHSSPTSLRITTLTVNGSDCEAWSMAGALGEKSDPSCPHENSTQPKAAPLSPLEVRYIFCLARSTQPSRLSTTS